MIFKNKSDSLILNDLIFVAHFEFSVCNLTTHEIIYEDKTPYGPKKRQVSHIVYLDDKELIFLISFNGDFAIYHINNECNSITKLYSYFQKGTLFCDNIDPVWIDKEFLITFLEKQRQWIIRKITFEGKIFDHNLNGFLPGSSKSFLYDKNRIVRLNDEPKLIDMSSLESLNFFEIPSLFPELKVSTITDIFTNGISQDIYCATLENNEFSIYKREPKLTKIFSFKRQFLSSNIHSRFLNGDLIFAEEYVNYISCELKIAITTGNTQKEYDFTDFSRSIPICPHLSSFSDRWISFVDNRTIYVFDLTKL